MSVLLTLAAKKTIEGIEPKKKKTRDITPATNAYLAFTKIISENSIA
jgi:hypothetical protein